MPKQHTDTHGKWNDYMKNKTRSCKHGNQTPTFSIYLTKNKAAIQKRFFLYEYDRKNKRGVGGVFLEEVG